MCEEKRCEVKSNSKKIPKPTMMDDIMAFKKKYEDLAKKAKIKETQGVKRKPLSDGVLPLTKEELQEFSDIVGKEVVLIEIVNDAVFITLCTGGDEYSGEETTNVKAILWLNERFKLLPKDK